MSVHGSDRPDRATAEERLFDTMTTPRADRLVEVLAAAAAPGTDKELAGEQAVMAAFTQSRPAAGRRARASVSSRLANLFTSKAAAAALVGSVSAGGLTFAAGGDLPNPFSDPSGKDPPPAVPSTPSPSMPVSERGGPSGKADADTELPGRDGVPAGNQSAEPDTRPARPNQPGENPERAPVVPTAPPVVPTAPPVVPTAPPVVPTAPPVVPTAPPVVPTAPPDVPTAPADDPTTPPDDPSLEPELPVTPTPDLPTGTPDLPGAGPPELPGLPAGDESELPGNPADELPDEPADEVAQ